METQMSVKFERGCKFGKLSNFNDLHVCFVRQIFISSCFNTESFQALATFILDRREWRESSSLWSFPRERPCLLPIQYTIMWYACFQYHGFANLVMEVSTSLLCIDVVVQISVLLGVVWLHAGVELENMPWEGHYVKEIFQRGQRNKTLKFSGILDDFFQKHFGMTM